MCGNINITYKQNNTQRVRTVLNAKIGLILPFTAIGVNFDCEIRRFFLS